MVISIQECSAGNETVGRNWVETKTWPDSTPIHDIIRWGRNTDYAKGMLYLSEPQNSEGYCSPVNKISDNIEPVNSQQQTKPKI